MLDANGWQVVREFYYNDAGVQIHNLALSVQARCRGIEPDGDGWPADGYRGDYIKDVARAYLDRESVHADGEDVVGTGDIDDLDAIRRFAVAYLRREQDADLRAFGVEFDVYYLESSLYADGKVEETTRRLVARGPHLRGRRRAVAPHDRVRRRQGSRDAQVRRHVHVLPAGRRLSPFASGSAATSARSPSSAPIITARSRA